MTLSRFPLVATTALALIALSACARTDAGGGSGDDAGAAPSSSAPETAAGLVLRMTQEGGFVPAERIVGRIPEVSVYSDGRVITEGPVPAIYPGPAMPNLQVTTISPDEVAGLAKKAQDAGVRTGSDLGQPNVADAPNTRIDVIVDGATQSVSVAALGMEQANDPRLTPAQREARAKLSAFIDKVREFGASAQSKPYAAEKIAALAQPYVKQDDGLPGAFAPVAWTGPALPGEFLNPNVKIGCVIADGPAVLAATQQAKANQQTPWTSGKEQFRITFRPLLPDEAGCADLRKQK
ncbi:hypothetical protein [Actinoplanes sp. NBRC 103695]|uniref:hypothetical protein n=1 Tax=Actinoplanes sp. NBRC 103695 TaxID=3032202 RepID=UPI0025525DF5|nr:hypothetical protein [Actinoplanes sp. NBRC 103695]